MVDIENDNENHEADVNSENSTTNLDSSAPRLNNKKVEDDRDDDYQDPDKEIGNLLLSIVSGFSENPLLIHQFP